MRQEFVWGAPEKGTHMIHRWIAWYFQFLSLSCKCTGKTMKIA